jgi:hypothetical protein
MIKVRPGETIPHLSNKSGSATESLEVIQTGTVFDSFVRCDVLVGTYSTVLYEAAYVLKPAVIVKTSFSYGHDLAYDKLADFAESPQQICDVVLRASQTPKSERIRRRNILWGEYLTDGASALLDMAEERLDFFPNQ